MSRKKEKVVGVHERHLGDNDLWDMAMREYQQKTKILIDKL